MDGFVMTAYYCFLDALLNKQVTEGCRVGRRQNEKKFRIG